MNNGKTALDSPRDRLISLDAFRGITMMAMVMVNNPGSHQYVYPPLEHAEWNGCTFTDLIFPFFLFIVGVSMAFSFVKRMERAESKRPLVLQIIRRTIILFALGLVLNVMLYLSSGDVRIPGVLQRIAICYFVVSWMALYLSTRMQIVTGFLLLAIYWIGIHWIPVPGYGTGLLQPQGNFAWWIDQKLLGGYTWPYAPADGFDPEGVWSTLTAINTTLLGYLTGQWLRRNMEPMAKLVGIFAGANLCLLLGYILTIWMPYNKNLWSASFMFHTAGMALHVLGMFYLIIDCKGYKRFTLPMLAVGANAIFVYMLSSLGAGMIGLIPLDGMSLRQWLTENLYMPWLTPVNASLAYALSYVLLWVIVTLILYRKKIVIKV